MDVGGGDGDFLVGRGVAEQGGGAFGAEVHAGFGLAVFQRDGREAEVGVDVAAGVEDVFDGSLDRARTDTVERGAEVAAGVFDAVAGGAVLGEERRSACGVGFGGGEGGGAGEDESVEAGVFGGEIFNEGGGASAEGIGAFGECIGDVAVAEEGGGGATRGNGVYEGGGAFIGAGERHG